MTEVESTQTEEDQLTFESMPLTDEVRKALDEVGYANPTPVQHAVYPVAVEGHDIIVQARTGTGKTAAFGIPMVDRIITSAPKVQALVLAPTRELALQSSREMVRLGKHRDIRTTAVYGGAPMGKQIDELAEGAQIVSGTPGRVLDHLKRGTLDSSGIKVLVLDEMDEMLSMGFARELNAILELIPDAKSRQTMCFSATVDGEIRRHAEKHMRDPRVISLSSDAVGAEQVTHYVYTVSGGDRSGDLITVLETENPESAIVFCNMRSETERVASALQQAGFNADWLNGDLPQRDRETVMAATREGKLRFLVATDVAARGIDISHLTHVINYSFPESPATYVHRTGRTGRAGRTGCAISLVAPQELGRLYYLRLEYGISPVKRSLPTTGELQTRKELDRIELLAQAFPKACNASDLATARRLLTHDRAEQIIGQLVRGFFGDDPEGTDEQAAASRRSKSPRTVKSESRREGRDSRQAPRSRRRRREESDEAPAEAAPAKAAAPAEAAAAKAAPAKEPSPGRDSSSREDEPSSEDGGPPRERLYLNVGRKDGVKAGDLARMLREEGDLDRDQIGRIRVRDRYTLVEVDGEHLDNLVQKLKGKAMGEQTLEPERARSSKP